MSRMTGSKGHTLIELIITLAVMGVVLSMTAGLGYAVLEGNSKRAAEAEYEHILEEILKSRNTAMMSGETYGTTVGFYKDYILFREFDPVKPEKAVSRQLPLKQCRMTNNFTQNELSFSGSGVVNKGGTLTFSRNNRADKYLVVQPVTGRIYLSDKISR